MRTIVTKEIELRGLYLRAPLLPVRIFRNGSMIWLGVGATNVLKPDLSWLF